MLLSARPAPHSSGMRLTEPAWGRVAIIILITALSVLLSLAAQALFGTEIAYTSLFYLAIIPAAFWYPRRAIYVGLLFAAFDIAVGYIFNSVGPATLFQAGMLVVVAYLLGYLFEAAGRRHGKEETAGRHLRVGEHGPEAPACDRDTKRLIARLSNRNPDARYRAAECLGEAGEVAAVGPLAALLRDPESGVRWKATEALGKLGSPAVGPLTESLRSENVDVRWMAAVALGDIGDSEAVPALMEALNDEDAYVRSRAALALGAIGEPARERLIASLSTGNGRVRWGVALGLGKIGGESAVDALIGALHDPDTEVRQRAASALGDIGEPALPSLIEALRRHDADLRQGVVAALGQVGRPALPSLLAALRTGDDPHIRAGAAAALGEIGDPRSVDALIESLDDEHEEVRAAAREALGSIRKT